MGRVRISRTSACGSLAFHDSTLTPAKHDVVRTRSAERTSLEAGRHSDPGWAVQAIARIRLGPAASQDIFEKQLREIPGVLAAWHVTGDVDYETLITCRDLAALGVVIGDLRRCCGGEVASAELILSEVSGLTGPDLCARGRV